ncbi:MAG: hypothetical protein ACFB4I_01780 [Cyanophyceae cyanobacterium]
MKDSNPPRQFVRHPNPLPDPWETPPTDQTVIAAERSWPSSAKGKENLVSLKLLPAHRAIAQDLLADELKLTGWSSTLQASLDKALALLYWLEWKQSAAD